MIKWIISAVITVLVATSLGAYFGLRSKEARREDLFRVRRHGERAMERFKTFGNRLLPKREVHRPVAAA